MASRPHQRLLSPEDAERWRERVKHGTAPSGVRVMVDEIERLFEQFETQRLALLEAVRLLTWYRRGAPGVPPPWEQVDAALLKADEVLNPASRSSE